ncbi:MAG: hypothetical protein ACLP4V_16820 [Methylocella sp.]
MDSGEHNGEAEVSARKALTTMARLERQDKSRTLLGLRMGKIAKENNLRTKGARGAIKVVNGITRCHFSEPGTLRAKPR